jgi:hypothetical protein
VVRSDVTRGTQSAMIVHAAGESSPGNLPDTTHAVVLVVDDEAALMKLSLRLHREGLAHRVVREPDAPWNNAIMAIGIAPARKDVVRRHVSSLRLLR